METRAQGGADAHECEQCGETFPTEQELEQHVEQQHPSQDQDPPLTSARARSRRLPLRGQFDLVNPSEPSSSQLVCRRCG